MNHQVATARAAVLASQTIQKDLRKSEKKAHRAALWERDVSTSNSGYTELMDVRESLHNHRMEMRKVARLANLSYAYLRGIDYKTVEQSVREGNVVHPDDLFYALPFGVEYTNVVDWLNAS